MENKLDPTLRRIITNLLDKQFEIVDNHVRDLFDNSYISPLEIENELVMMFDIDEDGVYIVLFDWLYQNGVERIKDNWSVTLYEDLYENDLFINNYGNQTYFTGTTSTEYIGYVDGYINVGLNSTSITSGGTMTISADFAVEDSTSCIITDLNGITHYLD
jgi:hypothetical protein